MNTNTSIFKLLLRMGGSAKTKDGCQKGIFQKRCSKFFFFKELEKTLSGFNESDNGVTSVTVQASLKTPSSSKKSGKGGEAEKEGHGDPNDLLGHNANLNTEEVSNRVVATLEKGINVVELFLISKGEVYEKKLERRNVASNEPWEAGKKVGKTGKVLSHDFNVYGDLEKEAEVGKGSPLKEISLEDDVKEALSNSGGKGRSVGEIFFGLEKKESKLLRENREENFQEGFEREVSTTNGLKDKYLELTKKVDGSEKMDARSSDKDRVQIHLEDGKAFSGFGKFNGVFDDSEGLSFRALEESRSLGKISGGDVPEVLKDSSLSMLGQGKEGKEEDGKAFSGFGKFNGVFDDSEGLSFRALEESRSLGGRESSLTSLSEHVGNDGLGVGGATGTGMDSDMFESFKNSDSNFGGGTQLPKDGSLFSPKAELDRAFTDFLRRFELHLKDGKREAVVELHPPELGKVRFSVEVYDDRINARFWLPSTEVKNLFESNLQQLQSFFRNQGYYFEASFFYRDSGRESQGYQKSSASPKRSTLNIQNMDEESSIVLPEGVAMEGMLDIFV
ncbi:MAG: flagellar hook-length control protein FliK [Synergistetes bacterium]|nr:flagellar hook-length control protein FliK [Synergistota bacterium]